MAARNHLRTETLTAIRGEIHDRGGNALAINTAVYDVTLDPRRVDPTDRGRVADVLSSVLSLRREDVMSLLLMNKEFVYVAHRQPQPVADLLRGLALPGVGLDPQTQRAYQPGGSPNVSLASSLLGFV